MRDVVSLHGRMRGAPARPTVARATPIEMPGLLTARLQKASEALQEAIFALQITHARMSVVIDKIENQETRETLRAQSARIHTLIGLAWSELGTI